MEDDRIVLDKDGFISSDLDIDMIYSRFHEGFTLAKKINSEAYSLIEEIETYLNKKGWRSQFDVFFIAFFIKMHKDFQAIFVLLLRGLEDQVKILLRAQLEKLYIMKAVSLDETNMDKWLKHQEALREKTIKSIKEGRKGLEDLEEDIIDIERARAERLKKEGYSASEKFKKIEIYEWAKLANMEVEHNTMYKALSEEVHGNEASFTELIIEDDSTLVIDVGPRLDDVELYLHEACRLLKKSIEIVRDKVLKNN